MRTPWIPATLATFFAATALFAQGPPEEPDFTITKSQAHEVVDRSIARLNERYIFPETAKKMEQSVRARATAGAYDNITSAKELARMLTDDFQAVSHDKHLHVFYSNDVIPDEEGQAPPSAEQQARQRSFGASINFGFEKVERMQGNIGYVDIRGFVPPADGGETASAAMNFIANSDALIIDLRNNHGGTPAMIAYVQSYLFDAPTHLNDIYTRVGDSTQQWWTSAFVPGQRFGGKKPIYVLTSHTTFSGGEEFAYNLKNLHRATLLGETTGGGAHPVRAFKVSDHFEIGVPFARAINPITKTNWEGTGVSPDIAMAADAALDAAYKLALQKVIETTSDPERKTALQGLLKK